MPKLFKVRKNKSVIGNSRYWIEYKLETRQINLRFKICKTEGAFVELNGKKLAIEPVGYLGTCRFVYRKQNNIKKVIPLKKLGPIFFKKIRSK